MPNYYAAGISIHLTTGPLSSSISDTLNSQQSALPRESCESPLTDTKYGERMLEENVDCFDDESSGMPKFLGPLMNMPFFCVAVKQRQPKEIPPIREFATPVSKQTRASESQSSGLSSAPPSPDEEDIQTRAGSQARLLSLRESTKAQISTPLSAKAREQLSYTKKPPTKHHSTIPKSLPLPKEASDRALYLAIGVDAACSFCRSHTGLLRDIKVEYFVNGNFAGSTYWAFRFRHDRKTLMLRSFSGLRINRREEKAWVFRNPAIRNNGGPFKNMRDDFGQTEKTESRWKSVGNALQSEANLRGMDPQGKRPPSADYLTAIANMPEPPLLKRKSTTRKFGVIDVLVTLGHGKKFAPEAGHLREPRRMLDNRFAPITVQEPPLHSLGHGADLIPRLPPLNTSEVLAKRTENVGSRLAAIRGQQHQPFHLEKTSESQPYSEEELIADSKFLRRGSRSSDTLSPRKQSSRRKTTNLKKCTLRERMKRAPLGIYDTSKLRPVLALEDFIETVQPIYQTTTAASDGTIATANTSKLKLILSSNKTKSTKPELGLAAIDKVNDHPEDSDFSPKKQKPEKQKKTGGRGKNWRKGLGKYESAKDSAAAPDNPIPAPGPSTPVLGTLTTTAGIWTQASDVGSSSPPSKKRKSNIPNTGIITRVSRSTTVIVATESANSPLTASSSSPVPNSTTKDPGPRRSQLPLKTSAQYRTSPVGLSTTEKSRLPTPEAPTTRPGLLRGTARNSARPNLAITKSDTSPVKSEDSARGYPLVAPPPRPVAEVKPGREGEEKGRAARPKPRPATATRMSVKLTDRQLSANMSPNFRAKRVKMEPHAQSDDGPFLPSPNGVTAMTPKTVSKGSGPATQTPIVRPTAPAKSTTSEESFTVPALSKDCVITYLPGATRKVPLERPGEFFETEVLLGVRFLALG